MFNLPTYRITPSAHRVKCPPQCPSSIHPHLQPSSGSISPSSFPRVRSLSCSVSLSDISHLFFSPFPFIPFHYYLYSPNEWEHMFVLRLTHFTQHNTLQFHPRWSKWWVFVVSNGWVIFHIYINHIFFIHSSFDGHRGSFHCFAIVNIAAINIRVQVSERFIASISLG